MVRLPVLIAVVLLAAACGRYDLVRPGRVDIGGAYSVEPQISWNKQARGDLEIWTVDGPLLHQLIFTKGLEDGKKLFPSEGPRSRKRNKRKPAFDKRMNAVEIVEFFDASITQQGATSITTRNLRPAPFGAAPGFRFEFDYVLNDGLDRSGLAVGAVTNGKLYMIIYVGARLHHYPAYRDHVEKLVKSITMK